MSKYQQFKFRSYKFNKASGVLTLKYGYDDQLKFSETYKFDFPFAEYDETALDRALQLLFFMAGISYYKMYLAPDIVVESGQVDEDLAAFLGKTYQRGLGEFFYINQLSPKTEIIFPVNSAKLEAVHAKNLNGLLVGLGGGKDSLVSVELLKGRHEVATWSLNHKSQLAPLVERVGLPHNWVDRTWDEQIKTLNSQDALNGHIPISAIFACTGTIVAILSGQADHIVSNESSASEPNLRYQDVDINHQYSKSLEFERDFQAIQYHLFGEKPRYYSLLRPYSELHIAEMFAKNGFNKYKNVFSSCNRAFTLGHDHMSWCGECAKCAFVFLALTPFVGRVELESLWGGKNLLLDPVLGRTYQQLLGIEGDKPLDCVGEIKESRSAMRLAQNSYRELSKYIFDIPSTYDWRASSEHAIPEDIYQLIF